MNPDQLLKHFEAISEADNAVPRLRQFILELAVRGKLVEQDLNDEPATKLLKRIEAEKGQMVKEGKIQSQRVLDADEKDDKHFAVPGGWTWCRLSEVGAIVGGSTPPSNESKNFSPGGTGIAWLTPADLGRHKGLYVSHGARDLTPKGLRSSSATVMPKGSVLFTSRAPIGYTAIAANEISTNQGFKSVVPYISECNLYISVYFRAFAKWINAMAPGTTFREVSGKVVSNLPFPLPPLAEQHRIVAKVDELMALCDELEVARTMREIRRDRLINATLHRLNNDDASPEAGDGYDPNETARFYFNHLPYLITRLEHIKQLRQTILNLAVQGRLVAQDPNDEPAEVMLSRITSTAKSRGRPHSVGDGFEQPFEIPSGWTWVRLPRVLNKLTDGTHHSPPNGPSGDFKYVTAKNIKTEGVLLDGITYVSKQVHDEIYSRCNPNIGDVLYIKDGATTGIATINQLTEPFSMLSSVALLKPSEAIFNKYLLWVMRSPFFYNETRGAMKGAAITRVTLSVMAESLLPLPPITEQHRIVTKVDELMALCDELETQLATTASTRRQLLEATLHEALGSGLAA